MCVDGSIQMRKALIGLGYLRVLLRLQDVLTRSINEQVYLLATDSLAWSFASETDLFHTILA